MSNEQIKQYINQCRTAGKTDEQIKADLINAGWATEIVNNSLKKSHKVLWIVLGSCLGLTVIIVPLISVLIIGAINAARNAATEAVNKSNAKVIETALEASFTKNKKYPNTKGEVEFTEISEFINENVNLAKSNCSNGGGTVTSTEKEYKIKILDSTCTKDLTSSPSSTSKYQKMAVDAANKASLHEIKNALELYYDDNKKYPKGLQTLVDKTYLRSIPNAKGGAKIIYEPTDDKLYTLKVKLFNEKDNGPNISNGFYTLSESHSRIIY